ncbi:ribonuclease H-like protein [Pochonia chlamydosporia 170]|uniref:Ribonuclease H-like protein n=1 Tax=Pochonia chlamydosporia 170 TaxID=1380566 RepID=A0A179EXX3_METCM|nr:ribonuclease H-like protein [Pochonia chlamydosporia 170]OAQ58045.2 ribonuclease H-like protein [Pochonia chlamydosporia 170]
MPQQRLHFVQTLQRKRSTPSDDLLARSSQQPLDTDESYASQCQPSPPRTGSVASCAKPRTSWIFSHMPDEDIETRYYNQRTRKEEWRRKYCEKTYSCSGGTAAPTKHLTDPPPDGHGLPKGAPRSAKVRTIRTILEQARLTAEENVRKRRRLNNHYGDSVDPDQLEVLYVRFIAACSLPFRLVECAEFRALLSYVNADIDTWLPDTHQTIKKWIMRQYEDQKEKVKQRIQSAKSRIHISCDLWTSPNSLAILGVVAHYVTEDGKLEHHTLALKDIDGEHDGSHLAAAIMEVVEDWGFASKLGYFVMDNATNNDTMMKSLSLALLRQFDIQYDPKSHRLRCQGHIINLAAKSFLFVTDNETLEHEDSSLHNVTLKQIEAWRRKGPLGKLHNFAVYIQRSVQRSQKFMAISHNRRLARDNDTRWNSWYTMLRAALNLREAIDGYFNKWVEADCAGDRLSAEDWTILEKIESFLEKLKMTTKALESSFATLDHVLLAMDFVLAQFEAGKEAYTDDPIMAPMYNSGWAKLDKYYRLTDESPAYVAAIVLHPSHKWHYIHENWKREWIESSEKLIEALWGEYKPVESLPLAEAPSTTTNEFLKWRNKHLQPAPIRDEYEHYCRSERVYGFTSALTWWVEETQQKTYPNLSKMAVDILSIPAMAAEPERLFSGAKITITDRRNRMGSDVVEALECLKSWFGISEFQSTML